MRISQLLSDRIDFTAEFAGGDVKGAFNPQKLTPRVLDETMAVGALLLPQVLVEWNLETSDGQPVPITEEAISQVPAAVLEGIVAAVYRANRPNLKSSGS